MENLRSMEGTMRTRVTLKPKKKMTRAERALEMETGMGTARESVEAMAKETVKEMVKEMVRAMVKAGHREVTDKEIQPIAHP